MQTDPTWYLEMEPGGRGSRLTRGSGEEAPRGKGAWQPPLGWAAGLPGWFRVKPVFSNRLETDLLGLEMDLKLICVDRASKGRVDASAEGTVRQPARCSREARPRPGSAPAALL